jgi:predicted membrane channel-forming protein YqfA (hemolysin III family)
MSGARLRDKVVILVSLAIGTVGLFFQKKLLKNKSMIYGTYLIADVIVNTNNGTFFVEEHQEIFPLYSSILSTH